ncbi:GNAT family N-acetyltransferase [Paenibacillus sp. D2_2]|uniref:GNAT family N-acetyltransferase n=1 Tax=Paenibacillus sp. D2_2 TaxID=3073092 RepID=UPI00281521ED|nr:GNAT family N-acetyltransferase [Paenibacillus sp. D2_2]WMT39696.1 GNAT family N-acetyltransferase [Paenibacillus sp. D2_2]
MDSSNIVLLPISKENEMECISLKPKEDQINLVASNSDSLEHAKKEITSRPYGIYADDNMVGFVLFDNEVYSDGYYWILRFMIDHRFQGNGYGKSAIKQVIEFLKKRNDCREIRVSHVPSNIVANALYKSCGFEETGEFEECGDPILRYRMINT